MAANLKPPLNAGEADGAAFCACAMDDSSDNAADVVMAKAARSFAFGLIIWIASAESGRG